MPRSILPIVLTLTSPLLGGLVLLGCGSSGGGGGGSAAAAVSSGTSAQTTTASTTPIASTTTSTTTPPTTTPPVTNNTTPIPTTSEDRYYNPHVRSVLLTYCTSCHANSSNPAALGAYELSGFPTDINSFNETKARTNDMDPEASLLMQKALGNLSHGGGKILDRSDAGYAYLVNWVRQGARLDEFVNAPRTFARDIQPILNRSGCFGCHSGGAGGYTAGNDLMTNYNEFISVTETANPANSRVILKNDGGLNHAGGAPWRVGRVERDVVLEWIADGRRYAQ
jgi:hypothetical protein